MKYWQYIVSTLLYGLFAVLGLIGLVFFIQEQRWFLAAVSAIIIYVSVDNFFCGTHFRSAGGTCSTHYVLPPFLKGKK